MNSSFSLSAFMNSFEYSLSLMYLSWFSWCRHLIALWQRLWEILFVMLHWWSVRLISLIGSMWKHIVVAREKNYYTEAPSLVRIIIYLGEPELGMLPPLPNFYLFKLHKTPKSCSFIYALPVYRLITMLVLYCQFS